jgi:hypothetical protein
VAEPGHPQAADPSVGFIHTGRLRDMPRRPATSVVIDIVHRPYDDNQLIHNLSDQPLVTMWTVHHLTCVGDTYEGRRDA